MGLHLGIDEHSVYAHLLRTSRQTPGRLNLGPICLGRLVSNHGLDTIDVRTHTIYATRPLHPSLCAKAPISRFDSSFPDLCLFQKTSRHIAFVVEILGLMGTLTTALVNLAPSVNAHIDIKLEGLGPFNVCEFSTILGSTDVH